MKRFPAVPEHAQRLLSELTEAAADVRDARRPTPCQRAPELFMSDAKAERSKAVGLCAWCPLRQLCGDYAEAAGEDFGVWGGRDRTR